MDLNQSQFRLKSDSHELTLLVGSNLSSLFSPGEKGDTGDSAYQAWETLNPGGTVQQFIDSIKGVQGDKGDKGDQGDSIIGPSGLTAYEIWEQSNTGQTLNDFFEAYRGTPGTNGTNGIDGDDFTIDAIDTFANRVNYDGEATDFVFYATDTQELYIRRSTPASWSNGIPLLQGPQGIKGDDGDSAYDVWLQTNAGDEAAFLASLTGPQGIQGNDFAFDATGPYIDRNLYNAQLQNFTFLDTDNSVMYIRNSPIAGQWSAPIPFRGPQGDQGIDGLSAYDIAVNNGYQDLEVQWLDSLIGPQGNAGDTAYAHAVSLGFVGTLQDWLDSLTGYAIAVQNGFVGTQQDWLDTLDGYGIALQEGFVGTKAEWLASLIGPQGDQGLKGDTGITIQSSTSAPSDLDGNDGDFHINTALSDLYGPKAGGVWPTPPTSLLGQQGIQGEQGLSGDGTAPFLESRKRNNLTAYEGQTSFGISSYNVGFLDIYLNGVLLLDTADYTATDNFNVVLNSPASLGDKLTAISYAQFEVASGNHDNLVGFEPDEHINWLISQAPQGIHPENIPSLRLPVGGLVSNISTDHPMQIGDTALDNIVMDENTIMARNNGAVAPLNLNPGGTILGDGSQLTGINTAHNYLRYEDATERSFGTGESAGMVSPSITKTAGSAILVNITTATRNDDGSWGGMFFRMEFSIDGGTVWEDLGNQGYDGNMVNSGDSIEPWAFTQLMVFPPILAATQFAVRLFHKSYSGTGTVGTAASVGGASGVTHGTNYSIGIPQITLLEIPV